MKKIRFRPNVQAQVRAIEQKAAPNILEAIHRYADTDTGRVKPLRGEFEGLLRLRAGNHRVFFDETADTITIHRVRDRREELTGSRRLRTTLIEAFDSGIMVAVLELLGTSIFCLRVLS